MNEAFIFLLLTMPFVIAAVLVALFRRDLASFALKAGIIGGVMGLVSEWWYFVDYWRPPTLFGTAVPSLEDVLFGAGITALGASLYYVVSRRTLTQGGERAAKRQLALMFGIGLAALLVLTNLLGVNSIVSSSAIFLCFALYMLVRRPALLKPALQTMLIVSLILIATYGVLFGVIAPHYIDKYFLLTGHPLNPTIFGFLPLAELVWYVTFSLFISILTPYLKNDPAGALQPET